MTDEFDDDELTREQLYYLSWRKTEPTVETLADAETLARRAYEHGYNYGVWRAHEEAKLAQQPGRYQP